VIEDVWRSFDRRTYALRGVSLDVVPGEFAALTGPSGSGKSTLLQLIGSLDHPDRGRILVDGVSVGDLRRPADFRRRVVGFVFQLHHLLPHMSAADNIELAMIGTGRSRSERAERARRLLGEVGLGGRADARPSELSGGERQRVAVARAVANEPRLLLADEPTGALDTVSSARVLDLMEAMRERRGTTMLVVSYDPAVADRAGRELRLTDGELNGEATARPVPGSPRGQAD
jgi:putative ABC transport system ATP-binding protein